MIRSSFIIVLFCLYTTATYCQQKVVDSLLMVESRLTRIDSTTVSLYLDISKSYQRVNFSKGLPYNIKAVTLARNLKNSRLLASALSAKGTTHIYLNQYEEALLNLNEALILNTTLKDERSIANNHNNIGLVYSSITSYPKALEHYTKSLEMNEKIHNVNGKINNLGNIGSIFNALNQPLKAIDYFSQALVLAEKLTNSESKSSLLNNIGNSYTTLDSLELALEFKIKALEINKTSGNQLRIANSLGNLGNVYFKKKDFQKGKQCHQEALNINTKFNDKKGIISNLQALGEYFLLTEQLDSADIYINNAYKKAIQMNNIGEQAASLQNLSKVFEKQMRYDSAYTYYKLFIDKRNSLETAEKLKEITQTTLKYIFNKKEDSLRQEQIIIDNKLQQQILIANQQKQQIKLQEAEKQIQHLAFLKTQAELEIEQNVREEKEKQIVLIQKEKQIQETELNLQQAEIKLKNNAISKQNTLRIFYLIGISLLFVLLVFIFRNFQIQKKSNKIIGIEKAKSDNLLLNILPNQVAEELKNKGSAEAKYYDTVSVIFTDFVGFTKIAEALSPQELVNELHTCFSAFDDIVLKYGIEKIKTIGDAYMAVSGLPTPTVDHAQNAVNAAQEFLSFIENRRQTESIGFEIRIGIHSGPVIAGIVGTKKFAYDIWGDTVNIAARMESSGMPGQINISEPTFELINNQINCIPRGKIMAKNKGEIEMYFVNI